MRFEAIIFDFDGVIVDSEVVANATLAETLTRLGSPTTVDQALDRYCGRRWKDCTTLVEEQLGRTIPEDFFDRLIEEAVIRLSAETVLISGAADFIDNHRHRRRAIASSSAPEWLYECLHRFGLNDCFGDHVYSAAAIERGKPNPDIYLYVADRLGIRPEQAVVIEDSPTGVEAGAAAGMTVIGLLAGGHIRDGHGERLRAAGAHHVARDYDEAERIVAMLES